MWYLVIRPCLENALSESGVGIVMGCRLNKKFRKNSDSNPIKKSKNQKVVFSILLMNVTTILERPLLTGVGISIISVDGSIWIMPIVRWIRIIWNPSCGFSSKSGRNDMSTKGNVFHGILGNSRHQFQILKSRWMIVIRMFRIQQ